MRNFQDFSFLGGHAFVLKKQEILGICRNLFWGINDFHQDCRITSEKGLIGRKRGSRRVVTQRVPFPGTGILDRVPPGGYWGLQGFVGVYRCLQGFVGVYGLIDVYKGLQGFIGVYRGLQPKRRLQGFMGLYRALYGFIGLHNGLEGPVRFFLTCFQLLHTKFKDGLQLLHTNCIGVPVIAHKVDQDSSFCTQI